MTGQNKALGWKKTFLKSNSSSSVIKSTHIISNHSQQLFLVGVIFLSKLYTQREVWIQDPKVKSHMI